MKTGHLRYNLATTLILSAVMGLGLAPAAHGDVSLTGSNFEIDADANLKVDHATPPSLDWANVEFARKDDEPTGTTDDSFGQGTKEDTQVPSVVSGSIPPNKSDLLTFGFYQEEGVGEHPGYMHLFWTRVQEPKGTTNMDFEFNQSQTPSANGETPVRTVGDLLIVYELSQGGTNPVLALLTWIDGSETGDSCEASNSFPCWGNRIEISGMNGGNGERLATGSINSSPIPAADSAGLGSLSARTFGEASIDLSVIFDSEECESFGSAYLKSRSSDSFTAALKDFIAPIPIDLTNCGAINITKKDDAGTLLGGVKFDLYADLNGNGVLDEDEITDEPVQSCTTALEGPSLGTCTMSNVLQGDWCVAEDPATIPANHEGAEPQCDSVAVEGTLFLTFENPRLGYILVKKVDQSDNLLAGAAFDITSPIIKAMNQVSGQTAYFCADQLSVTDDEGTPISYTVTESQVPDGYTGEGPKNTTATPGSCADVELASPTLTFTNERKPGAIRITKVTKHYLDGTINHDGVSFAITDAEGLVVTGSPVFTVNGEACIDGLTVGETYTVTETVPTGYAAKGNNPKTVLISDDATCEDGNGDLAAFENTPLAKFTISFDSLPVDDYGATKATVTCADAGIAATDLTDNQSVTSGVLNFETQATYTCTIFIDP